MKLELWAIGKTNETYLEEGLHLYIKRLKKYLPFEWVVFPDVKNAGVLTSENLKIKEAELVLSKLKKEDFLVLMDERGQLFTSVAFARQLEDWLNLSHRKMVLLIGGAYGFAPAVYERANALLSLSKMTFSHQMVRLFTLEQLYRGMTILRGEPYHNE